MFVAHSSNLLNKRTIWQESLADLITDPAELLQLLDISMDHLPAARKAAALFPLRVPREFVGRMERGNPHDPLLHQVLPIGLELRPVTGYTFDPLDEKMHNPVAGMLHKYPGRILVTLSSACAVHCRYCFRRHFAYDENNPGKAGWQNIIDYLQADETISEVILSGGDPLTTNDKTLREFIELVSSVSHVNRLRIHTRLPIVIPARITDELIDFLGDLSMQVVMVVHVNHPQEIDEDVESRLQRLRASGVTMLNQSVLLKGVNDDSKTLAILSEVLFASGVLPYYLHVLDKVDGAAHFDVEDARAKQLYKELTQVLPGYLVPRLVREKPGELSKTDISTGLYTV